jgi:hypothetical protein
MTRFASPSGLLCTLSLLLLTAPLAQADDAKPGRLKQTGPLKVYILAGQSNMQGKAKAFTLQHLAMDPVTVPMLAKIQKPDGTHRVYQNVWISSLGTAREEQVGNLTVGYGGGDKIGPELTFGIYMYEHLKEPILIIKTAWGGKSLSIDFRPPSAGPLKALPEDQREKCGHYYRKMIAHVKHVLADVKRVYPDYNTKLGYNVEGFVWFQGCNDFGGPAYPNWDRPGGFDEYTRLLACLIRDVRKEVKSPNMRVVIGVIGINGELETKRFRQIDKPEYIPRLREFRKAMAAPADMPQFKGKVVAVHTEKYWDAQLEELQSRWKLIKAKSADLQKQKMGRADYQKAMDAYILTVFTKEEWDLYTKSISNAAFHYMGSAKILGRIGKAFAEGMISASAPDKLKKFGFAHRVSHFPAATQAQKKPVAMVLRSQADLKKLFPQQTPRLKVDFDKQMVLYIEHAIKHSGPFNVRVENIVRHDKGYKVNWYILGVLQGIAPPAATRRSAAALVVVERTDAPLTFNYTGYKQPKITGPMPPAMP